MSTIEREVRKEWHAQPVSLVIHVVTLIVMIAGFGAVIGVMQERQEVQAHLLRDLQSAQMQTYRVDSSQDGKIAVLEAGFGQLDRNIDKLIDAINHLDKSRL